MLFDFFSAFNTIQPVFLQDMMELMGVDQHLSIWVLDYLTSYQRMILVLLLFKV